MVRGEVTVWDVGIDFERSLAICERVYVANFDFLEFCIGKLNGECVIQKLFRIALVKKCTRRKIA